MFFTTIITLLAILVTYRAFHFVGNYIEARKIGLPILVTPFTWQDPFWNVLGSNFSWIQHLPFGKRYKWSYLG